MDNEWLAWQASLMVTFATAKTAQELRDASVLVLCYDNDAIEAFIAHRDRDGLLAALLAIPGADACWALAAWLPAEKRTEWARGSSQRANEYASPRAAATRAAAHAAAHAAASAVAYAAYAAAHAATRTASAAACAAYAADRAADAAACAADAAAEREIAVRHGVLLLTGEA